MSEDAPETVRVLDQATRARIRAALHDYRAAGWAPLGVDCHWWSEFAKGRVKTVPLSRLRTIAGSTATHRVCVMSYPPRGMT